MKKLLKLFSVLFVSCICVTSVANAETIQNNYLSISTDTITALKEFYYNSNYYNYVLTSKRVYESDYRYVTYYYMCLTNNEFNNLDPLNINTNCDVLYILDSNGNFSSNNNDTINIINSNYYSSNNERVVIEEICICFIIVGICLVVILLIFKAFHVWYSSRGGGLTYEDI